MEFSADFAPGISHPNSTIASAFTSSEQTSVLPQSNLVPVGVGGISSTQWMTPAHTPPMLAALASPIPLTLFNYNLPHSSEEPMDVGLLASLGLLQNFPHQYVPPVAAQQPTLFSSNSLAHTTRAIVPPSLPVQPALVPATVQAFNMLSTLQNIGLLSQALLSQQAEQRAEQVKQAEMVRRVQYEAEQAEKERYWNLLSNPLQSALFSQTGQPTQHACSPPLVTRQFEKVHPALPPKTPSHSNPFIEYGQFVPRCDYLDNAENGLQPTSSLCMNNLKMESYNMPQERKKKAPRVPVTKTVINMDLLNTLDASKFILIAQEHRSKMVHLFLKVQSLLYTVAAELIGIPLKKLTAYLNHKSYANAAEIETWYIHCICFPKASGMVEDHANKDKFPAAYRTKNKRGTIQDGKDHDNNVRMVQGLIVIQQTNENSTEILHLDSTFKNMNVHCSFGQYAH